MLLVLDRLIISCTFSLTCTRNNVSTVNIHTALVTSRLDPGRKWRHALILGDLPCEMSI